MALFRLRGGGVLMEAGRHARSEGKQSLRVDFSDMWVRTVVGPTCHCDISWCNLLRMRILRVHALVENCAGNRALTCGFKRCMVPHGSTTGDGLDGNLSTTSTWAALLAFVPNWLGQVGPELPIESSVGPLRQ
jgi:hypothetical protein